VLNWLISGGIGQAKLLVLGSYGGAPSQMIDLSLVSRVCPPFPQYPISLQFSNMASLTTGWPLVCGGGDPTSTACYQLTPRGWIVHSNMNIPKSSFALIVNSFGSDLLFAAITWSNIEFYYQSSNTWNISSVQLPFSILGFAALFINKTTILCTGGNACENKCTCTMYDDRCTMYECGNYCISLHNTFFILTSGLVPGPPMRVAREEHGFSQVARNAFSKDRVFMVAGGNSNNHLTNSVEIFDVKTNEWLDGLSLPFPMGYFAMTEDAMGGVLIAGGMTLDLISGSSFILHLPHAGPDAIWKILPQKLNGLFISHAALVVPNHLDLC